MNSLLKMLPAMIRLSGDNEEVREQAVFAAWKAVTNYQLAQTCAPFRLYRKTLVVATKDLLIPFRPGSSSRGRSLIP